MNETRKFWVDTLVKIAKPVFSTLAVGNLKKDMPIESTGNHADRAKFSHLEAFGRSLAGVSPWLATECVSAEEEKLRLEVRELVIRSTAMATDPSSPDFMNFTDGHQPIVDAAFLAHGFLRDWSLWGELDTRTQDNLVSCMKSIRTRKPCFNNWLLFSGIVEVFLAKAGADWDPMRVDFAILQHEQWYKGDGAYGDGPNFHWDYYNSFVIHPMLYDIVYTASEFIKDWDYLREPVAKRLMRYAEVQERLIAPDGSFPPFGRSLAYRFGAFQALAQATLLGILPEPVSPAQVRCGLTAVIRRMAEAPGTFDENGWLTVGFCGHQPSIGEQYISTGSLYLCLCGLLPLGLPESHAFWSAPDADWTAKKIWNGIDTPVDHAR